MEKFMIFNSEYLPQRFIGTPAQEAERRFVWNFKDGKRNFTLMAAEHVATSLYYQLCTREVVFVCIPASTAEKTSRRYDLFSQLVCSRLQIENGFEHISVSGQRLTIHEKKYGKKVESTQVIDIDSAFFDGKDVVIFDDIYTTGGSFQRFSEALEAVGARVIGGIFLAKTINPNKNEN